MTDRPLKGLFKRTVEADFFRMFCGEYLGGGVAREVFVFEWDQKYVVKIENGAGSFQNVTEWNTWCDAEYMHKDISKWFAPCHKISACGTVLIQTRTKPLKKLPEKMPSFFTDFKKSNYGLIGRQIVSHDYGLNLMCNSGLTRRMSKVNWTEEWEST